MPFVIALDSADVWANPQLFLMDPELNPSFVAVPPDYFSATGQLWGNPLYNWPAHQEQEFKWWVDRLGATLRLVDLVRLDHFRGFAAAWQLYGTQPRSKAAGSKDQPWPYSIRLSTTSRPASDCRRSGRNHGRR